MPLQCQTQLRSGNVCTQTHTCIQVGMHTQMSIHMHKYRICLARRETVIKYGQDGDKYQRKLKLQWSLQSQMGHLYQLYTWFPEPSPKKAQKDCKSRRSQPGTILSSGHNMAIAPTNLEQLWLPTQALQGSSQTAFQYEGGVRSFLSSHHKLRRYEQWQHLLGKAPVAFNDATMVG